jgi:hypothetical protein
MKPTAGSHENHVIPQAARCPVRRLDGESVTGIRARLCAGHESPWTSLAGRCLEHLSQRCEEIEGHGLVHSLGNNGDITIIRVDGALEGSELAAFLKAA